MNTGSAAAVVEQKANYCRLLDTRQWDAYLRLFDKLVQVRIFDAQGHELTRFESAEGYLAAVKSYLADSHSHHRVWDPRITILSEAEVTGEWEMEDFIVFFPGDSSRPRLHHGGGRYSETWKLRDGEWVITRLELRRSFLETPSHPSIARSHR